MLHKIKDLLKHEKRGHHIYIDPKARVYGTELADYSFVAHHAEISSSTIGKRTSVGRYTKIQKADIGAYCSISWDVTIGALSHPIDRVSGHAFTFRKSFGIVDKDLVKNDLRTIVGNDVWIGCGVIIRSGVRIGDGAVIGAGAVVLKDVEPYEVVVGVPARRIRYRYEDDIVKRLRNIKWWEFPDQILTENIELFQQKISLDIVEKLEKIKETREKYDENSIIVRSI